MVEGLNLHKAGGARTAAVTPLSELAAAGDAGPHAQAVRLDVARTPLARLWRGAPVPRHVVLRGGHVVTRVPASWDLATPEDLAPFRAVVADLCAAMAGARPDVGYCQGMDYVAAMCLRGAAFDVALAHKLLNCLLDDLHLGHIIDMPFRTLIALLNVASTVPTL